MKRAIGLMLVIILIASLLAVAIPIAAMNFGVELHSDVSYADGEDCKMDIYLPTLLDTSDEVGCVIFIHGGSWMGGDKADEELRARLVASQGYVAVSISYTLYRGDNDYRVTDVLDDIDSAIDRLYSFADERGIKLSGLALSGYSAGAHLALLYSYSRAHESGHEIAFVLSMAGPTLISPEIWGDDLAMQIGEMLTGEKFDENLLYSPEGEALLEGISPTAYVDELSPPTLILQGAKDTVVPPACADALVRALEDNAVTYECVILPNSNHGFTEDVFGLIGFHMTLLGYCNDYLR